MSKVIDSSVLEIFVVQIEHRTRKNDWYNVATRDSQVDAEKTMAWYKSQDQDSDRNFRVIRSVTATITTEVGA